MPGNRWRINATGEKFTCHDEREAVARFLHGKSKQGQTEALVQQPLDTVAPLESEDIAGAVEFTVREEPGLGLQRSNEDPTLVLNVPEDSEDPLALLHRSWQF